MTTTTQKTARVIVCSGAPGDLEEAAAAAAGYSLLDEETTEKDCDLLLIAASSLAANPDSPDEDITPFLELLQPLQKGLARLRADGQVIIVSDDPYAPDPDSVAVSAFRAALLGMCRGVALEYAGDDLRVNLVAVNPSAKRPSAEELASTLTALSSLRITGQRIDIGGVASIGYVPF